PDALGVRQADARLDPPVLELALALADHARGAVLAGAVPAARARRRAAPGLDHQHPAAGRRVVLDEGVLAVGVVLPLLVAPAVAAGLEGPVGHVGGLELVRPGQRVELRRRGGRGGLAARRRRGAGGERQAAQRGRNETLETSRWMPHAFAPVDAALQRRRGSRVDAGAPDRLRMAIEPGPILTAIRRRTR